MSSGVLCMIIVSLMGDVPNSSNVDSGIFAHPLTGFEGTWFDIGGNMFSAFILGTFLGFACLLGDSTGSFVKRRRGLKREGVISSKAPLLDTLPFAIMVFLWGQLFLGNSLLSSNDLILPMLVLVLVTPVLHRSFNLIGYAIGWKDVPY